MILNKSMTHAKKKETVVLASYHQQESEDYANFVTPRASANK
jgi:hypothetical protein